MEEKLYVRNNVTAEHRGIRQLNTAGIKDARGRN